MASTPMHTCLLAGLAVAIASVSTARAEDKPAPRPLAIAVSGGASLGAYEAGFLLSLIEDLRRLDGIVQPRGFFGTSAGAINAFLAILQTCSPPLGDIEDSPFYKTWMPISFATLFDRDRLQPISALSRSALEAPIIQLKAQFARGLPVDCDQLLGVTATRVSPYVVSRSEGQLRLPRMDAQFLLRVRGRGRGRPPKVSNHVGSRDRSLPRLPLDGETVDAFNALLSAILASSAFPFAFAPVEVPHCPGRLGQRECSPQNARKDLFLDGGIFDQNPVRIGIEEVNTGTAAQARDGRLYLLDPFHRAYPTPPVAEDNAALEDALSYASNVAAGFVATARSQGLETLLRDDPALERRLIVGASKYPPFGDLAFYFLSFFEEGFRRFDFILGMIESQRGLKRAQSQAVLLGDMEAAFAMRRVRQTLMGSDWPAYRCIHAILGDGDEAGRPEDVARECRGEEHRLLPLAMVSRERVYDACRPDRWKTVTPANAQLIEQHPDCKLAFLGHAPPQAGRDWPRQPEESELKWVFRRLEAHGYRFVDLGSTARSEQAFETMRTQVMMCASDFAQAQDILPGFSRSLARALVNSQIGYRPPKWIVHFALGASQELGLSFAPYLAEVPWLRLTTALELRGLPTILSAQQNYLALSLTGGLEAEVLPLSDATLQVRAGLRGGWLFGSPDDGGFGQCSNPGDNTRPCSRPVIEANIALHIIDLFRIALTGQVAPSIRNNESTFFEIRPSLSAQLSID